MDESSNWEVFVGPVGSWITTPFSTQGEISMAVDRSPRLVKFHYDTARIGNERTNERTNEHRWQASE
jgi:hypothetical protein